MGANGLDEYWVPEHVKDYLRKLGFILPLDDMEPWIRNWDDWMSARGEFYDYRDKDGMGRVYAVHRRSIHPSMRVCKEWGSLLLNEEVKVVCENQKATASTITSHTISESLVFDNAYAPFVMNGEIWASTNENGQWKLLQDKVAAGSDVMLFGNVKDPDGKSGAIRVKDNKTATIDLNGWTIDRNRTGRGNNGHAIAVEKGSTLTIKDGSQDKSGKITGGHGNDGGGINNRGTLKVEQANITGNDAEYGGGIANYGVLEMTGGKVTGNTADKGGGIDNMGTLTVTDGSIEGNKAERNGGGIWSERALTVSDCAITNNSAPSG